jgi:sterol desaturase/sphingolipid hydroxylase (fatty acid hydroxylase superfamily)
VAFDVLQYREEYRRTRVQSWYRGRVHFLGCNLMLGGMAAGLLSQIHHWGAAEWCMVPLAFLYSNVMEYWAHRIPLHVPTPGLKVAYKAHGIQHHRFYTAEHMAAETPLDWHVVLFHPISYLGFIGILGGPPGLAIWAYLGAGPALAFETAALLYFLTYEWMHLIYHLPQSSLLGRIPGMAYLREHHLRHHDMRLMSKWNFNITFPIFDRVFGTTFHGLESKLAAGQPEAVEGGSTTLGANAN